MDILIICFWFLIFICNLDPASGQEEFWGGGANCGGSGNYTWDSDYRRNLDDVLYALTQTNNGFGFFNSTFGEANAAAVCRGDVEPEKCRRCVDDATRRVRQDCPDQTEAAGWYDTCLLRYSNRSMGYQQREFSLYAWNARNASDSVYAQWNRTVVELLSVLLPEAEGGGQLRKYASRNITPRGFWTIYGMMQCSPELSEAECGDCLAGGVAMIRHLSRSLGARVFRPNCFQAH